VLRYKRRKITLKNNLSIKKPPFQEDLSKLKLRSSQRIKILPVGDIGNVGGRVPIRYLSMGIMFLDHRGHREAQRFLFLGSSPELVGNYNILIIESKRRMGA